MKTQKGSFLDALSSLSTSDPKTVELAELSGLDDKEMDSFKTAWSPLDDDRRERLLKRLVELAEENVELNFNSIFRALLRDHNPAVRKLAIDGLWEDERTNLIEPLLQILSQDPAQEVRAAAAVALGKFALLSEHGNLSERYGTRIRESLLKVFYDTQNVDEIRRRALESLAPMTHDDIKKAIAAAYSRGNERLKIGALYAMGKSCDTDWLAILMNELANSDAEVRYEAAVALGEVGDEEAVPKLIERVADADTEVQRASIQALGNIGGTMAKEYLQSCMASRDEAIRENARQALNELRANDDPLSIPL